MKRFLFYPLLFIGFYACTNDQLAEPVVVECETLVTYTDTIKMIIDQSCAYDGCHVAGFGIGDFSNYDGMRGVMNNNSFKEQVIDLRAMP